ncbi:phage tail protein [Pseudomonas lurida]|uniref:Phage tail protein n=1 Tax=Pseudomonas lurida TaxID=244566 RepID=A0ABY9FLL7_9PSED|nr:phage tail protein [Pseudomonas lurida]WLH04223.1 phage tail protein [Pseudomonas lurida]
MVDKNSIFGGMITTLGAAKKTNCDALGVPWEPRYMLIGDANGADPVPSPSQTKLINQVYRAQLNQLRVSPTDANVLIAEVVLPPDVGGWHIRELALEDKDGVFSAVANVPPSYKPLLAQGSGRNQVVRMHIITSGTSNIQLKIDPAVVLATRQYVDESVNGLLPANKPAGAYTKVTVNDRGVFVSGSNPTTLAGYGITDTYTKDQIATMIAQASALPVGSVIAFPVNKVAPGFLELDGSVKSATAYPDLATFLGGVFNKGDEGGGNFRLPESRGEFLRGWDHGRGIDAGRVVGSSQLDQMQGHLHAPPKNATAYTAFGVGGSALAAGSGIINPVATGSPVSDGVNGDPRAGAETRPRNLAVMWCIKAWNAPINQGNIDIAALVPLAAQATEINQGTAKVATAAQMLDSENDSVMATPKKLRLGFKFSPGANGYITFPSWMGGLIIQWGALSMAQDTAAVATMSIAFPATNFWEGVTGSINRITGGTTQSGTNVTARTLSTITIANDDAAQVVRWITVGY